MARYVESGRPEFRTGSTVVVRSAPWDRAGRAAEQVTRQARDNRRSASLERYAEALTLRAIARCEREAYAVERRSLKETERTKARVERAKQRAVDAAVRRVQREDKIHDQRKACGNMAWLASE
jgi:hypothetical protein